jgi:hypothetical protein
VEDLRDLLGVNGRFLRCRFRFLPAQGRRALSSSSGGNSQNGIRQEAIWLSTSPARTPDPCSEQSHARPGEGSISRADNKRNRRVSRGSRLSSSSSCCSSVPTLENSIEFLAVTTTRSTWFPTSVKRAVAITPLSASAVAPSSRIMNPKSSAGQVLFRPLRSQVTSKENRRSDAECHPWTGSRPDTVHP